MRPTRSCSLKTLTSLTDSFCNEYVCPCIRQEIVQYIEQAYKTAPHLFRSRNPEVWAAGFIYFTFTQSKSAKLIKIKTSSLAEFFGVSTQSINHVSRLLREWLHKESLTSSTETQYKTSIQFTCHVSLKKS